MVLGRLTIHFPGVLLGIGGVVGRFVQVMVVDKMEATGVLGLFQTLVTYSQFP